MQPKSWNLQAKLNGWNVERLK